MKAAREAACGLHILPAVGSSSCAGPAIAAARSWSTEDLELGDQRAARSTPRSSSAAAAIGEFEVLALVDAGELGELEVFALEATRTSISSPPRRSSPRRRRPGPRRSSPWSSPASSAAAAIGELEVLALALEARRPGPRSRRHRVAYRRAGGDQDRGRGLGVRARRRCRGRPVLLAATASARRWRRSWRATRSPASRGPQGRRRTRRRWARACGRAAIDGTNLCAWTCDEDATVCRE